MVKIEVDWGDSIDIALQKLRDTAARTGSDCCCEFNGTFIYSTDTIDVAYLKVCGISKEKMDKRRKEWQDEQIKKWQEKQNVRENK